MANSYSFLNVNATIVGPGGFAQIGSGAGAGEEGITITPVEDKNVMQIGADGQGQHSLIASNAAKVTVRLLKTSPWNGVLMAMFDAQSALSSLWGTNQITVTDPARGDLHIGQSCAFTKKPEINYKKDADIIEWNFDCINMSSVLSFN